MAAPGRWDLDDPVQVAQLVRRELLAGVVAGPEPALDGAPTDEAPDGGARTLR
jgi:hypothetical protein